MDYFLLHLAFVTYLFGPAVAIPFAGDKLDIASIAFFVLALQAITVFTLFRLLEFLDYTSQCNKRIISKVCSLAQKELGEISRNAETITERFHDRRAHDGYYLALLFLSFAMGFSWAVVISYSLKLRRLYSYTMIMAGSALSFVFWYTVLQFSLNFVTAEIFTIFSVCTGLFLLFYGSMREMAEVARLASFVRTARSKVGRFRRSSSKT